MPEKLPTPAFLAAGLLLLATSGLKTEAALVFPEERRLEILENAETLLVYNMTPVDQLSRIPDPFGFGREIPEDEPEQEIEGIDNEDLLTEIATILADNILGYQSLGDRSFFPTRDFGLLRAGESVTLYLPGSGDRPVTVRIISATREGFSIQMGEDLETFVPASRTLDGIRPSRPTNNQAPTDAP